MIEASHAGFDKKASRFAFRTPVAILLIIHVWGIDYVLRHVFERGPPLVNASGSLCALYDDHLLFWGVGKES